MTPHIAVRPLMAADHAAWDSLWRRYLTFYEAAVPDEVSAASFARLADGHPAMGGMLAWQGDEAVGMVNWIMHPSTWTPGDYCYLQDLYVGTETRGAGIGRQLIEAVYDVARERGCSRVYWLTHESNSVAMALYDKVAARSGFIQYRKML